MYWETPGPDNTGSTLKLAATRARELGIGHLVVASCSGATALNVPPGPYRVVCVSHHVGFAGPGLDEMPPDNRKLLAEKGIPLLTTTHLLAGVDRSLRKQFGGVYPAEIIAQTLRLFGQGVKVGVEIACMALDAGLVPYGQEVVAVGGTGRGADAAIVVLPAHSSQFFAAEVKEIICMPRCK